MEKNDGKGNTTYDAYALVGFPYVFHIWAYEVIPLLGMKYASRIERSFPRICNLRSIETPKHTQIQSLFLEPNVSMIFFSHFNCYLYNHILLVINYFHCHFNKQLTLHSILIPTLEKRD